MSGFRDEISVNYYTKYDKEIQSIIDENGYGQNISLKLKALVPVMIQYYGEDYKDVIFSTLRETKIIETKDNQTIYDVEKENSDPNIIKTGDVAVNDGELKRAAGVYFSEPILEIGEDGKVVLQGRKSIIVYRKMNDMPTSEFAYFTHEVGHAIKSNINEFKIEESEEGEQFLITRCGLSVDKSKVYAQQGKFMLETIYERNVGLEEGINCYEEESIVNMALWDRQSNRHMIPEDVLAYLDSFTLPEGQKGYESKGYGIQKVIAENLMKRDKTKTFIRRAQIDDTLSASKEYNQLFKDGIDHWKELNEATDESVRIMYDKYANAFNIGKWLEENSQKEKDNIHRFCAEINAYKESIATEGERGEQ